MELAVTREERKRISAVVRATEYLFLENIALKLVLEHRAVLNWQKLLARLMTDKEIMAGVHLKFQNLYSEIEMSEDPSQALEVVLGALPKSRKPQ
jgi:hypothetical protein